MLKFQSELTAGGGLRKRNRISQVVEGVTASPIAARIQKFDIYNKAPDFVRKKTWLGGCFSAIVAIALASLVISELSLYLTVNRQDTLSVDSETGGKINIYLNITYPRVHCDELHIDTVDQSGAQQIDVHQRIFKTPTDENGQILDFSHMHRNVYQTKNEQYDPIKDPESPYYCGSCYGAVTADKQCCNSCEEVKQQWKRTGRTLPHDITHFEQCLAQGAPGCNMYGALEVQKVGGNFHFAPGRSFSHEHDVNVHHIHEFNPLLVYRYNGSHIINELTFGEKIPHVKHPLNGVVSEPTQGLALHKYFIKVVPTTYKRGFFTTVHSYQYSVTKHVQTFDPSRTIVLPGVFFVYELSPMRITYRDYNEPFLHFVVRLCAVFGGLFAVAGYIDKFLHMISGRFAKKAN